MSTSVTKYDCQIVIYFQKELFSELDYCVVEVWQDFDRLKPYGNEKFGKAECLWSDDNLNVSGKPELTEDTLESLIAKATQFIKEDKEKKGK
jgi:hypothetical protein